MLLEMHNRDLLILLESEQQRRDKVDAALRVVSKLIRLVRSIILTYISLHCPVAVEAATLACEFVDSVARASASQCSF